VLADSAPTLPRWKYLSGLQLIRLNSPPVISNKTSRNSYSHLYIHCLQNSHLVTASITYLCPPSSQLLLSHLSSLSSLFSLLLFFFSLFLDQSLSNRSTSNTSYLSISFRALSLEALLNTPDAMDESLVLDMLSQDFTKYVGGVSRNNDTGNSAQHYPLTDILLSFYPFP